MDDKLKQVLRKVELLCEQNPDFAAELRKALRLNSVAEGASETIISEPDSFAAAMRLQHKRCRDKAREFYGAIVDADLYQDLVNDYAEMLWYKSIFEVGQYFVHVNFQMENLLNYYLDHTDFHNKVAANPALYRSKLSITSEYTISIDVFARAFDANNGNRPIEPAKVNSLWAKLLYWAIDTNRKDIIGQKKKYFNAIISVRNENNHANYSAEHKQTNYWQKQDSLQFGFVEDVIRIIRDSIIDLDKIK